MAARASRIRLSLAEPVAATNMSLLRRMSVVFFHQPNYDTQISSLRTHYGSMFPAVAMMASTSISTTKSGWKSAETSTSDAAGRISPKTSLWALP